jgi:hypothetical protein
MNYKLSINGSGATCGVCGTSFECLNQCGAHLRDGSGRLVECEECEESFSCPLCPEVSEKTSMKLTKKEADQMAKTEKEKEQLEKLQMQAHEVFVPRHKIGDPGNYRCDFCKLLHQYGTGCPKLSKGGNKKKQNRKTRRKTRRKMSCH